MLGKSSLVAIVAGAALLAGGEHATQFIVNGDFSNPNVGGGYTTSPTIPGWTNDNGDTLEIGSSPIYGLSCYTASCQNLEVNAYTFDTDSQTVTGLTIGQSYLLSFAYGGRNAGGPQALDVSFGGVLLTTDTSDGVNAFWTPNSFRFLATATTETLVFQSLDVGGNQSYGNEITDVSLTNVPEPATWAFMLVGAGCMGAGLRMRRRVALSPA
jgi:hypothetical protein